MGFEAANEGSPSRFSQEIRSSPHQTRESQGPVKFRRWNIRTVFNISLSLSIYRHLLHLFDLILSENDRQNPSLSGPVPLVPLYLHPQSHAKSSTSMLPSPFKSILRNRACSRKAAGYAWICCRHIVLWCFSTSVGSNHVKPSKPSAVERNSSFAPQSHLVVLELERIVQKRPATPIVCGRVEGLALHVGIASVDEIDQDRGL